MAEPRVICPPEGNGGDPGLNRVKNRLEAPTAPAAISFGDLQGLPSEPLAGKLSRRRWPGWWREKVTAGEARGVTLEGFVMEVRLMGPETANCRDRRRSDVHLALGESPDAPRARWAVTELTPTIRDRHPVWHMKRLRRLSKDHARVRITGWLMYDHEHLDRVGINRISAWEVHPVTKIEVWSGGRWVEF